LLSGVLALSYFDEVLDRRRVDLLILSGNQQASDSQQVVLLLSNLVVRQVPIHEVDCDVQGFRPESVLLVNFEEPVNNLSSHVLCEALVLALHVVGEGHGQLLLHLHVPLDLRAVLTHMVDVGQRGLVNFANPSINVTLNSLVEHSQLRVQINFRQFVTGPDLAS